MLEALHFTFMQRALLASVAGGVACGIVGVWVVLLGIPFVGVAMSHAAFAGAIYGLVFGVNPTAMALVFCLGSAALVGPMADRGDFEPNISVGIIFSLVLGAAFLGIGFIDGPKTEALKMIWGNILLVSRRDAVLLAGIAAALTAFVVVFHKQVQAVLFNREVARSLGLPETGIFYALLFFCGLTVTLNLNTIGGLLIFSLIVSPPSAAYQLTYRLRNMYLYSAAFAVLSCLSGLFISYALNVPSGAVIIIMSSVIFGVCFIVSPKRRVKKA